MTASPYASAPGAPLPLAAPAAPAATIGRRVGAYLIDGAIASLILVVATVVVAAIAVVPASSYEALLAGVVLVYAVAFVGAIGWGVVYTVMQGGRGSFGQRILGIRLADAATGAPIGFGRALVRNLVWIVSLWIIVGYFTPLLDSSGRRQGWHDKAGRAVVVSAKGTDAASSRGAESAVPWAFAAAPAVPTAPAFAAPPAHPAPPIAAHPAAVASPAAASFLAAAAPAEPYAASPSPFADAEELGGFGGLPPYAAPAAAPAPSPVSASAPLPAPAPAPVAGGAVPPLISSVPGVTGDRPRPGAAEPVAAPALAPTVAAAAATLAHEPVAHETIAATVLTATTQTAPGEDLDETRIAPPRARAVVALTWDDGTRTAVYGRTLFGRNPAREDGATVVAVRDETLSLSKTHFEIGGDGAGAWIADRHSTNGTVLVRDGRRETIEPGTQVALVLGDRLEFGDRSVRVGDGS